MIARRQRSTRQESAAASDGNKRQDFMARLWRENGWIDAAGEEQARSHYACFSVSPRRGLRVISLNSDVRTARLTTVLVLCERVQLHSLDGPRL